jgi:lysophospholipase L1-like esterase
LSEPARRGLVAVGDSITRGGGDAMLGLRMQSWALWLAEALEMPYTCLARDGAQAADALAVQVPRLRGPYDLGCMYLGVNDVRAPGFELDPYAEAMREIAASLARCCERLLIVSLPPAIGVPPAPGEAIAAANREIGEIVRAHAAAAVTPETLSGPELVQPDAVHLTARGEAHLALLACRALAREDVAVHDEELLRALEPIGPLGRARWMLVARPPALARDWRRRVVEGLPARLARWRR